MHTQEKEKTFFEEMLELLIIIVVIVVPIRVFIAQPFIVNGSSMEPSFKTGDYLIVDQLTYRFKNPTRGEVVVFEYPGNESKYLIKRIIGMPNEDLKIENGEFYIRKTNSENWKKIQIPNMNEEERSSLKDLKTRLEEREYFVVGDNSSVSLDSRSWGNLSYEKITGRALMRLFPFSKIDFFPADYNIEGFK